MGIFRTTIEVENHAERGRKATLSDVLVDTGSELTWVPEAVLQSVGIQVEQTKRFITATGARVERRIGYAIIHAAGARSIDEVVFAEPGDMVLLGARSIEGLNLRVDPQRKELLPAGPIIVAGAA